MCVCCCCWSWSHMHKCHKSLVIDLVVLFRVSVLSRMYCLFSYIRQFEFNMALFGCKSHKIPSAYWLPGFSDTITTTNSSRNFLEAEVMYAHQTNWFNSLATFFCHSQKPLRPPFLMKIKQLQVWPKLANKLSKSSLSSTKNL